MSENGDSTLLFSQIKAFICEMSLSMLSQGIPLNEIQTSDVMFYLELLDYKEQKETDKAEAEMDKLGL